MDSRSGTLRSIVIGAALVLIVAFGFGWVLSRQNAIDLEPEDLRPATTRAAPAQRRDAASAPTRQRLPDVSGERRRAPPQRAADNLPRPQLEDPPQARERAAPSAAEQQGTAVAPPAADQQPARNDAPAVDFSQGAIERALAEVGLDTTKMADLQRRWGELAAEEAKLRGDAQSEEWLDSPEFLEELGAIDADRLALRNEIGDEAYDVFLFASGQTNRVYITDVAQHSAADVAGLQTGDVILRYDGGRIFSTDQLLAEIGATAAGQSVRLDIVRQGQPLQVDIGAGPPGIVFDATQEPPASLKR